MAKATPDELSNCPGIGGIKVRRLNEAFNEPFRKPRVSGSTKGKEKAPSSHFKIPATTTKTSNVVVSSPKTMAPSSGPSRPRRSPSPPWDIDLDLNPDDDEIPAVARRPAPPPWEIEDDSDADVPVAPKTKISRLPREPSPDWDLDKSDDDGSDED
jgi:DNA excision repair protein ERCC-1